MESAFYFTHSESEPTSTLQKAKLNFLKVDRSYCHVTGKCHGIQNTESTVLQHINNRNMFP